MKKMKNTKDGKTGSFLLIGTLVCFALIAVYGIVTQLKTSYALPDTLKEIENVKEVTPEKKSYKPSSTWSGFSLTEKMIGNIVLEGKTTPSYKLDMFCLQAHVIMPSSTTTDEPPKKITYKRSSSQDLIDEGINSIVIKAYEKAYEDNNLTDTENDGVKTISLSDDDYYTAQIALWVYQNLTGKYETQEGDPQDETTLAKAEAKNKLNNVWNNGNVGDDNQSKKLKEYVNAALEANENKNVKNNITLDGNVEFKLSADEKYYQTGDLKLNIVKAPNTELTGFNLKFNTDSNISVYVVDSNNNVIDSKDYASKIISGEKFKFRINKDDLHIDETVSISGKISGQFKHMGFEAYEAWIEGDETATKDLQIALVPITKTSSDKVDINASITVPDTGIGYSGYIYIIGALVLIIGLSIVYVNTKVQEN